MKKYIVRLTDSKREICFDVIRRLKGTSEQVRRSQMLLKADADGPEWTDAQIADASVRFLQPWASVLRLMNNPG